MKFRYNVIVVILISTFMFYGTAYALGKKSTKSYADIREVDFNNFTYPVTGCGEYGIGKKPVKVKNGLFEKGKGGNKAYFGVVNNKILYGDVTNDGKEEAIVHTACGFTSGNGGSDELYVYILGNGIPKQLAKLDYREVERAFSSYYSDPMWSIINDSVKVADGILCVEYYAGFPHDNPSHIVSFKYRIEGNRLVLIEKPEMRSNERQ